MINKAFQSILIGSLIVNAFSCKHNDSPIGESLLPDNDLMGAIYCDTATVVAYTIHDDSIRTDESYIGSVANILGTVADPIFGRTDASIYCNMSNPNNTTYIGFGSNPKLDSVVLTLAYTPNIYYGTQMDPLQVNVYQLTQQIYYDSSYYSYSNVPYDSNNELTYSGAGQTVKVDPINHVYDGDVLYAPHMRIRLKNEVAQQFMDDTTKLLNTDALRANFNGLYITTKNTSPTSNDYGCYAYIDLTSPLSKVSIYYHNGSDFTTKRLDLTLYGSNAHFNSYSYDRTNASAEYLQQLDGSNISTGAQHLYIQGMANSKVKLHFPYLKNFSDSGKIAVSRAEVSLQLDQSSGIYQGSKYFAPDRLSLEGLQNDTTLYQLALDQSYNLSGNWGTLNTGTLEYHFNPAYTIEKLANGNFSNISFSVRMFEHQVNPSRVVIGGGANATYPAKLKLWYNRIK